MRRTRAPLWVGFLVGAAAVAGVGCDAGELEAFAESLGSWSPPAASPAGPPDVEPLPFDEGARDLRRKRAAARSEDKHLLVVFGADWCPYCRAVSAALADGAVHAYVEDEYEVVQLDVGERRPGSTGMRLLRRYAREATGGIPYAVVLDSRHRVVSEGHPPQEAGELLGWLEQHRAEEGTRAIGGRGRSQGRGRRGNGGPVRISDVRPPASDLPVRLR